MLNKNFWKVLVSLVLGVFFCVAFAACSEGHKHQLQEQAAVAATCTEAGHSEYWVCTGCDKIFSAAEGKNQITLEDVTILPVGHKLFAVSAKEATCTEDGYSAHYECENGCGKYFSDAEGKNEIDPNTVIIPKTEHAGIEKVQLGIDADEGRGWVYHWYCADCGKYFADIFGDEEMTEDEVFFESIPSVTISLTGKKDGKSAAITQGNVTLQSTYDGIGSVSGTVSTTVTLQNVYPFISYKISCDNYTGSIVFEKGKTSYEAELLYETYKAAGANPGAVDLSHMADADAYVTISNKTDKVALAEMHGIENLGKSYYWEANVKIDAKAFSMWADRIIFVLSDGGTSGDEGLALWMTQATDQIHICRYKASNPEITYGGQGNDQTGADSCKAVTSGLFSESGLNVRVFRNANLMSLFYLNEQGEWSIFYSFNTCEGDAKIALGAMGTTGGGVIFSDIRVEKLTYHATTVSVGDTPAYLEHFTDSDNNCYTVKGDPVTLDDLVMHYSVEDAKDVNLTDNDMTYWMNMLYYEIYHPDGTGAKIVQMPGAVDLISSFTENMQFVSDSGNDANAVMLDGTTRAHLKLDGTKSFTDIKITVGNDAKHIVVWVGAFAINIRVTLKDSKGDIVGEMYTTDVSFDRPSFNKYISFDIDTSALGDGESETYTLTVSNDGGHLLPDANVRICLAGIAVLGEEFTLTYVEEQQTDDGKIVAHYTDQKGNYYTENKILTTLDKLTRIYCAESVNDQGRKVAEHHADLDGGLYTMTGEPVTLDQLTERFSVENATDYDLTKSDAIYYEIYHQTGSTANVIVKQGEPDVISVPDNLALVADDGDNASGVMLDGSTRSHFKINGNNAFSGITIEAGKETDCIAVWVGAFAIDVNVILKDFDGNTVGNVHIKKEAGADKFSKLVKFYIDTSDMADGATELFTLSIYNDGGHLLGDDNVRIRLSGIALFGKEAA